MNFSFGVTRLAKQLGAFAHLALVLTTTALLGGCASVEQFETKSLIETSGDSAVNKRFGEQGYGASFLHEEGDGTLVLLAFSGGGKRSSAFSYGVLRGLREYMIDVKGEQRPLLDEVDIITSVSGGSFTAAYYGLHKEAIFSDYEQAFLRQDINSFIYGTYLLPWNWQWMMSSRYGTNDRMQEIYDHLMFKGATFADLIKRGRPMIWLGATDISYGVPFTFNQFSFDLLCADLPSFPVARAVAASNGFPVLFTPITLANHAERCGGVPPLVQEFGRIAEARPYSREALYYRQISALADPKRTKYVHLMDGGITDNLALRNAANILMTLRTVPEQLERPRWRSTRSILVVSVDGEAAQKTSRATERTVTGLGQILDAVTGGQIDRYNDETILVMRQEAEMFADVLKTVRCRSARTIDGHACDDVQASFVHLSLKDVRDLALRERLQSIPTGLTLSDEDVAQLIATGAASVKSSSELAAFRDSLRKPTAKSALKRR